MQFDFVEIVLFSPNVYMMLTANIHWYTEPKPVSKEKSMPEPSKKGKMNAIGFIVKHAYYKMVVTSEKWLNLAEVEAVEEKVKPTPAKKGTVLYI